MRTALRLILSLAAVVIAGVVVATAVRADGSGSCNVVKDPTCTVDVGGGGATGGGGGSSNGGGDPCAPYPNAAYGDQPPKVSQACADELHYSYCQALIADAADGLGRPPALWTTDETAAINASLTQQGCPRVVNPASLAEQAVNSIHFPHPSGDRSPGSTVSYEGYPFTYVNLWTYFWTNPSTWIPLTATASAAGLSATVTARPVQLVFNPGDGAAPVACAGSGRPWTTADGNAPPADGACGYQYNRVTTRPITSTQTIVWRITWVGTSASSGQLPSLSTSTSGQLQVMQIQTVVTR